MVDDKGVLVGVHSGDELTTYEEEPTRVCGRYHGRSWAFRSSVHMEFIRKYLGGAGEAPEKPGGGGDPPETSGDPPENSGGGGDLPETSGNPPENSSGGVSLIPTVGRRAPRLERSRPHE